MALNASMRLRAKTVTSQENDHPSLNGRGNDEELCDFRLSRFNTINGHLGTIVPRNFSEGTAFLGDHATNVRDCQLERRFIPTNGRAEWKEYDN
jgi:hypothetical protein